MNRGGQISSRRRSNARRPIDQKQSHHQHQPQYQYQHHPHHLDAEPKIVGNDDDDLAASDHEFLGKLSPRRSQQKLSSARPRNPDINTPSPLPSSSITSIHPFHGDETLSPTTQLRSMSEGEAVTTEFSTINIQDPQSPSTATSGPLSPKRFGPLKRPPNEGSLQADARPTKVHNRSGSGLEFNYRALDQTAQLGNQLDHNHSLISNQPSRPTSRTNKRSPLKHHYEPSAHTPRVSTFAPPAAPPQTLTQVALQASTKPSASTSRHDNPDPYNHPFSSDPQDQSSKMLKQPITRPITQEQLITEVKGIYQGLVMVEKKCVEIDQQQAASRSKLSDEQYQALTALHRTLLHEHHDFCLASQHPSASPALKKLATKYAMPARMWRHGIHSFLELLRHRLPDSLEHMLAFVYLAYSMMALLLESVPSFEETWIECLGDLSRYRMAIEESDLRDREVWSGVARMWYNRAADKSPDVGRIQHHLAVLARPNIVQQLFYYTKALVTMTPFQNARESIMLLFNPFLEPKETASQRYSVVESSLVKANGLLFVRGSVSEFEQLADNFITMLHSYIERVTDKFKVQGAEIAASLCAASLDFGNEESYLIKLFRQVKSSSENPTETDDTTEIKGKWPPANPNKQIDIVLDYWKGHGLRRSDKPRIMKSETNSETFSSSEEVASQALELIGKTMDVIFAKIGDKNTLSFTHVMLAFLWSLASVPGALEFVQPYVPWPRVAVLLNTLSGHGTSRPRKPELPSGSKEEHQLPEDFIMRGLMWSEYYYPEGFFSDNIIGEDERDVEKPSRTVYRAERCLSLGTQLASLDHWLEYDDKTKVFGVTAFGESICRPAD